MLCKVKCFKCNLDQVYSINYAGYHGACINESVSANSFDICIHCNSVVFCCFSKSLVHLYDLQPIQNKSFIIINTCKNSLPSVSFNKSRSKKLKASNIITKLEIRTQDFHNPSNHIDSKRNKNYEIINSEAKGIAYEDENKKKYLINQENKIPFGLGDNYGEQLYQISDVYIPDTTNYLNYKNNEQKSCHNTKLTNLKSNLSKESKKIHKLNEEKEFDMDNSSSCILNPDPDSKINSFSDLRFDLNKSKCSFKRFIIFIIIYLIIITGILAITIVFLSKKS